VKAEINDWRFIVCDLERRKPAEGCCSYGCPTPPALAAQHPSTQQLPQHNSPPRTQEWLLLQCLPGNGAGITVGTPGGPP